jgi:Prenyltransferase and squalene oxidase repeat
LTEHLRLNGVYWGLTALHLLGHTDALPRDQTIEFVLACQNKDGGFGAATDHDSHMLYTVSAIQILATVDALQELERTGGKDRVGKCEGNSPRLEAQLTKQTLPGCKILIRARSQAMSGERRILDSSTVPSMPFRSWT